MAVKFIESTDDFNNEIKKEATVVDFYADWCGPCKMLAPIYEQLSNEVTNVNFVKVNTDEQQEIAKKYNIMSIPTLIFFKDGEVVRQNSGFMPKEVLKEFIK
ncbi:thioredoxin [Spiroplasma taiwanense]|uniref:Thioredoxin n=1 Tax=Spiroplasma taiwanense CT-1 TaxID=1276220 RepID=S5MAQ7_9MOLU|nr:thioredoxin [Spiroplasma taiwanense]AGR40843.1 thioredoxin [Spiroplasma taiwanense CT-1]